MSVDDASLHIKFESGTSSDTSSVLTLPTRGGLDGSAPSTPGTVTPTATGPTLPSHFASKLSFWKRTPVASERQPTESTISFASHQQTDSETATVSTINEALATTVPMERIDERRVELEQKVVRECIKEFSRGQMFFSWDFDITRSLQHKYEIIAAHERHDALIDELDPEGGKDDSSKQDVRSNISPLAEPNANLPLWRRVDRKFWWNENLSNIFVEAGLHNYVLPIMQGFVQISTFNLPDPLEKEPTDVQIRYSIISRRSRERAGLRYQRRGIDGNANVANFVETESIVQVKREATWNVFGHVQIRGSIPLFWSQPGTSLKPPPRLDKPWEESMDILSRHFERTIKSYGPITAVNLAELTGKEAVVTSAFRDSMQKLYNPQAKFHEFDFHRECAGMKYENIGKLLRQLEKTFDSQGFFWVSGPLVLAKQKGVFRVNCIDCLDRTNVVMSAFARHVLNSQLQAVGFSGTQTGKISEVDAIFNAVWANNGDAISRAYAGTSALKGDFTRTGRRDIGGMLNDGMNSVVRMYTSTFSDYFSQACIDYLLGHRTASVFSEFLLNLSSTDPNEIHRLSKIRAAAIETSTSLVLYAGEILKAGWTLLSPTEFNTKHGARFPEKVLLLSNVALYVVNYDYALEKVKLYTRIPLIDIVGIQKGPYILSALQEASRNPVDNYGFILSFRPRSDSTRLTSYALQNQLSAYESVASRKSSIDPLNDSSSTQSRAPPRSDSIISNVLSATSLGPNAHLYVAFKALPPLLEGTFERERGTNRTTDSGVEELIHPHGEHTCQQVVDRITDTIRQACMTFGRGTNDDFIKEEDIVSLAEAQRLASLYSKFEYALKRMLWLGLG
ncbi:hypothetical protein FRC03_003389 [Tulasnella sp. 419]|nr:hypothetical protein FRC03_003389 [Tulasnella sp. 419]